MRNVGDRIDACGTITKPSLPRMPTPVNFMHILIPVAFALIIASMIFALYFMMHDRGRTKRMVWSLATRVGLSISLFLFILFASWMGWIHSTGIPYGH